ncbi:metalloprotease [Streptomyces sp. CB00455]|uniref:protealysin inhibitor emfourin n=1 Tax=Streptomyces sp. CB00455 TaxID=1703927 RepID=UPI00093960EA|nr:protealysin inhibitor emfourin [Streptomyces sp. CB00455]OKK19478.1 metalloprotease [Streptomyces sp. CB00455]
MRIQVVRTGGFAGIERQAEVDTSGLPDEDEWQVLVRRALRTRPPADAAREAARAERVRDGFSYRITVDGRTLCCREPDLSEAQRALISRVLKEGA